MSNELKACPFCGAPGEDDYSRHYRNIVTGKVEQAVAVYCTSCSADISICLADVPELSRDDAMALCREQWNARPVESQAVSQPFQQRVQPWMMQCFGADISADTVERNHRFLEESLELVQSLGCTQSEAHQLVDYVYGRPQGDVNQEVGGVMVTLAALCLASGLDMHAAGEAELARIWTMVEKIRAKQAAKPKHSPLPQTVPALPSGGTTSIAALLAQHKSLLELNAHAYFELAYTRTTDWMAWICSNSREADRSRTVLAHGQGLTPEEACQSALAQSKVAANAN